jgi:hypothetical protein
MKVHHLARTLASRHLWQTVAVLSILIAILSTVSPQVGHLGHGLCTTLPALVVAWFAITRVSRHALGRAFMSFWSTLLLGLIFIVQAGLRFACDDGSGALWQTFCLGPVLALVFLVWIGALTELGSNVVHRFRCWILFGWCISLAAGLPALIDNPGVARLTMGNQFAAENAAIWAPQGVGEYNVYTSFAVCLGPLFSVAYSMSGATRLLAILMLFLAAAAVIVSTFTMASMVLAVSLLLTLCGWVAAARRIARIRWAVIILVLIALVPVLYSKAQLFPQTEFVIGKVERLYLGISNAGLATGEETRRGEWFLQEIRAFAEEPFLGYIPHVTGQRGSGHSSVSNSLVLFGFFGALLWVSALWAALRRCLQRTGNSRGKYALLVGWFAWFVAGFLNPIWHSSATFAALLAVTLPASKKSLERNSPTTVSRPSVSSKY